MNRLKSIAKDVVKASVAFVIFVTGKIKVVAIVVTKAAVLVGKAFVEPLVDFFTPQRPLKMTAKPANNIRVAIERHPNSQRTTYHVDRLLNQTGRLYFKTDQNGNTVLSSVYSPQNVIVSTFLFRLVDSIIKIDGVVCNDVLSELTIGQYTITVHKGTVFTDKEIEPKILRALASSFGVKPRALIVTVNNERQMSTPYRHYDFEDNYNYEEE